MTIDIYSDDRLKEERKKNLDDAIEDLRKKDKYIMDKIENIANRFDMDKNEVYNTINDSKDGKLKELFIAVRLSKDPGRQNIFKTIFYKYMLYKGRNVSKLSNKYLSKYKISSTRTDDLKTTNLTFYEIKNSKEIYYYHKYTSAEGTAQGNQFDKLKNFVSIANKYCKNHEDNKIFVAVADGQYYKDEERIEKLEALAGGFLNDRIFCVSWDTLLSKVNI